MLPLLFNLSPIPQQFSTKFERELLVKRYNYCIIIAWVTLIYPLLIFILLLSMTISFDNPFDFIIFIPFIIVIFTSSLIIFTSYQIKNKPEIVRRKIYIIKIYSYSFFFLINIVSFLVWEKFGINSTYTIGIFVYALIFYEPQKKKSLLIYLLNFIIYILIIGLSTYPLAKQIIAYITGFIATFGGLLIAYLFYRTQCQEFSSRCQLESQRKELRKLNRQLNRLVGIDGLTHVANRRKLDEFLEQIYQQLIIQQESLAILLIDVDYFKLYNDTYGHQAGDDCLRNIAFAIQEEIRQEGDLVARYGGEEFVVVLSYTSGDEALQVGHRLCHKVRSLNIPHERSPLKQVTISIGVVSQVPCVRETPANLILKADKALYNAKNQGRNQCNLWQNLEKIRDFHL